MSDPREDLGAAVIDRVRAARTGERVALRPLRDADVPELARFNAHPEVGILHSVQGLLSSEHDLTEAFREWATVTDTRIGVAIETRGEAPELIGAARIGITNVRSRAGGIGMLLDPDRLGRGLGTEAFGLVLAIAFGELDLYRVEVSALAANERSVALARRHGFRLEGRRREAALIAGVREDVVVLGLLAPEWRGAAG